MSGPRGELVALSGEADPEERSEDSDEALLSLMEMYILELCDMWLRYIDPLKQKFNIKYTVYEYTVFEYRVLYSMHLAFACPTAGLDARVGRPRPLPRPISPVLDQLYSLEVPLIELHNYTRLTASKGLTGVHSLC